MRRAVLASFVLFAPSFASAGETQVMLMGEVPVDGPDHFFVPFMVPAGTVEIEVMHDDLSSDNILDWGLEDAAGFRGWGGGNTEDAVVGALAASRSYVAGPIAAGEWRVVVGKAQLVEAPAMYSVVVTLRDAPTLAPQPERAPYTAVDLGGGPRWYAGDFHVHSRESGDAAPALDEIAEFARGRGLDFAEISDHNTLTQLEFFNYVQELHPDLLLVPGMEYTTYQGHANAIGATAWVDHKIGQPGVTIAGAAAAFAEQGALLSINHPVLELGNVCIGCAWKHEVPASLSAVEVATTGLDKGGGYFTDDAIKYWDGLCATGLHVAAIGGSDDHRAGQDLDAFQSPIGDPTTMVYAESLSVAAIINGIRAGRTMVKLQGPDDPMVELTADAAIEGDTISADSVTFTATVTGAPEGSAVRFVRNGVPLGMTPIEGDPFAATVEANAPGEGEDRWRAEVIVGSGPRTITSHLWLREGPVEEPTSGSAPTSSGAEEEGTSGTSGASGASSGGASSSGGTSEAGQEAPAEQGCACGVQRTGAWWLALALPLVRRRRARGDRLW
ncbi:MAG: PHP domain-containing protein [Myxococcales bacterium]|nr:PHP domain-containing protein [Myxococcales bacterium]